MNIYKIALSPAKAGFNFGSIEDIDKILIDAKNHFNSKSISSTSKKVITSLKRVGNTINIEFESPEFFNDSTLSRTLRVFSIFIREKDIIPIAGRRIFKRSLYIEDDNAETTSASLDSKEVPDNIVAILSYCRENKDFAVSLMHDLVDIISE